MAKTIKKPMSKTEKNDSKILKYLKNQLAMKKEQLKSFEMPLDEHTIKDIRKMEELILKNKIWQLEEQISAIESIISED